MNETEELLKIGREWADAMVANDAELIGEHMADEWVMVPIAEYLRKSIFFRTSARER